MNSNQSRIARVVRDVRASFEDFVEKRSLEDPGFLRRMVNSDGWKTQISRILAFIPVNALRVRRKRYIFFSARHARLISRFGSQEAAIVGGPKDFAQARRMGLQFSFSGDLLAASSSILFGKRGIPSSWIVDRWIRFFSRQHDPCYLVVPSDTLPISLLLVKIADQCKNVRTVCVQHGLFNSGFALGDIEGRNSSINLVYCDSQRREMERRLPGALVEVMGFPAEFPIRASQASPLDHAILVGTGTYEDLTTYMISLTIFHRVRSVLERAGFRVEYRPHPSEKDRAPALEDWTIDRQPTESLLSGPRKVFIGFISTLLYEAHLAGHRVIILNDVAIPGYDISDFGLKLDTTDMDRIVEMISVDSDETAIEHIDSSGVRERFELALRRAIDRLSEPAENTELK